MNKILVTGALGNVGGYVARYALAAGAEVKAADINTDALTAKFGDAVESVFFDFTKPETFAAALEGVDRVFIMRPPHLGKPEDLKPFIDALAALGSMKLVSFLSLIGVENNPVPLITKSKSILSKPGSPTATFDRASSCKM